MTAGWALFTMVSCFLIAVLYGYAGFLLGCRYKERIQEEEKNGKV